MQPPDVKEPCYHNIPACVACSLYKPEASVCGYNSEISSAALWGRDLCEDVRLSASSTPNVTQYTCISE
jgi:hypothetical protein